MRPAVVMPLHDPEAVVLPYIARMAPGLRDIFSHTYLAITDSTRRACAAQLGQFVEDKFYDVLWLPAGMPVGDQFRALYEHAAGSAPLDQVLHLCFPDRLAFALLNGHHDAYAAAMRASTEAQGTIIYQRSAYAWSTHPANYRGLEGFVTQAGELLLGRALDFAWGQLAVRAGRLRAVMPQVHAHDFSIMAEIVLLLHDEVETVDVDWQAWEDPFILGQDAGPLKSERERSPEEVRKRLSYVVPMLQRLAEWAQP